ncbi:hypothetical protein J2S49_001743 [Arcanobacterium wilhelmae]|uniref:FtsX-like permease family protein n=1 Tax=Arcanobacterium wilhelmae TaxID=1803177 RepID=A0ABT9ND67_9ACTO|nr:hypothetical protein [Arcanobacterium wilhelmae]
MDRRTRSRHHSANGLLPDVDGDRTRATWKDFSLLALIAGLVLVAGLMLTNVWITARRAVMVRPVDFAWGLAGDEFLAMVLVGLLIVVLFCCFGAQADLFRGGIRSRRALGEVASSLFKH